MVQILYQQGLSLLQHRGRVNGTIAQMSAKYIGHTVQIGAIIYTVTSIVATRYRDGALGPESPNNPVTQAIFHVT